jgi:hypothetical protein
VNGSSTSSAHFSIPSLIAIAAAIGSFAVGAFWGLILAIVAIVFGFLGIVLALLPRVRGGIVSTFALFAGLVGIVLAVFKAVVWLL